MRKTLSLVLAVLMMLVLLPAVKLTPAVAEETASTYVKVESADDITDGSYLIVVDSKKIDGAYYAFNGTSAASFNKVDVQITDNTITGNYTANEIVITSVSGGYTLKNSANKYLTAGNGSNTIVFGDDEAVNGIAMNDAKTVSINMTTDAARELKLNNTNDQPFFRYYKVSTTSSSYFLPSLYKKAEGTTPPSPTTFTVKLNPGEHSDGNKTEQTVDNVTSPYQLPAADYFTAAEGWEFDCWNDGTNDYNAGVSVELTANTTFTAKWKEEAAAIPTTAMEQVTALNNGDKVVIYYPKESKVMTAENEYFEHATNPNKNKWQIVAADATLTDNVLAVPETAALLTVEATTKRDGEPVNVYAFKNAEGKYLYADGTDTYFVERDSDNTANTLFQLVETTGGLFIKCDTACYQNDPEKPQYLEFYKNRFTCYSLTDSSDPTIYTFQFYAEPSETPPTPPTPVTGTTIILFTNDVHCGIREGWGYAGVADLKKTLESYGNEVLLVDAGDHVQGGTIGSLTRGEAIIEIMNKVGYDLATLGNHEFDYGMARMFELVGMANYPYISANFMDLRTNEHALDSYKIFEANGKKIAFVGISTPESITKSTPAYFMNEDHTEYIYGFCQDATGEGVYAAVQAAIDAAKTEGADYVIAVGHMGIDEQSQPWTAPEVIANVSGLDAFIDGHSHSVIDAVVNDKDGHPVLHGQTGTQLANVGKLTIAPDGSLDLELLPASEKVQDDPETDAFITTIEEEFAALLNTVVAHTDHLLTIKNPETGARAVRNHETNLGDLCADAYRAKFDADIAFVNGGGVRADIPAGDITFQQIINVHPFGNTGVLAEVTGQTILDALEMGARVWPGENGGFLHVSGLTYEIHTDVEANVVVDDAKIWQGPKDPTAPYRVQNVQILNKNTGKYEPLDLNKTYTLASHNYMLEDMGDGFAMFGANANILIESGIADNQILIDYIQSMPEVDGKHEVEGYRDPRGEGRIKIVNGDTVVLFTNDVHCGIREGWGYAGVSELKKQLESEGYEVLLVDAGDHVQGGTMGALTRGEAIIEIMNATGYDLATLGNHEFDYGMDRMFELVGMANYPYVSANFMDLTTRGTALEPYHVIEANGKKIAFVGLSTPESITKSTPAYFMNAEKTEYVYGFCQDETGAGVYAAAQAAIDSAKTQGVDYIILVGHMGVDQQSSPWMSTEVIANITGIDAFIDGHSHTVINEVRKDKENKDVLHGQTGTKLENVGKLTIKADGTMTMELLPASDKVIDDPVVDEFIQQIEDEFAALLNTVVAHTDHLLTIKDPDTGLRAVRKAETNLGDLCADAYRTKFDADIAFVNGGGVRADIPAGDITFQQIINVHPFGNIGVLAEVTGQQILDALEMGAKDEPGENGGFLQVAGLTYEIHTYIEPNVVVGADKMWQGPKDPTAPYRVQNVMVLNKETNEYEPLDLEKKYTLASHNYMLEDMGDGMAMFGANAKILIESGIPDNQILIDYIQSMPVVNDKYEVEGYNDPKGEGRIKIIDSLAPTFYGEDVNAADVSERVDGDTIYRYDVKVKNVDPEAEVVGLQTFIMYEDDVLEFVEARTNLEGNTGVNVADGVISFAWASSGEGITLADGDTVVSLYFKLIYPLENGSVVDFTFVASDSGTETGLSYAIENTVVEAEDVETVDGSITFTLPTDLTIYGEDVKSLDIAFVEDGQRLYRYDIRVKDLPEAGLYVSSAQVFVEYDADLLTLVRAEAGALDWVTAEKDNKLFVSWASDTDVLLKNEDVILSLVFAAAPDAAGKTADVKFIVNALDTGSAMSVVFGGTVVELEANTVDGSIEFADALYGDANCDGKVTAADASLILRSLVGLDELTAQGAFNADVDGDLEVTAEDAALILRYIVQLIEHFPVEGPQD